MEHRPTPDHRCIVGGQEADGDNLYTVFLRGDDLLAIGTELGIQPQHDRYVGSVDVAVEYADPASASGQGDRKVDGHRRLADTPLAGADGNHVLHARQRRATRFRHRHRADVGGHLHVDLVHTRQGTNRGDRLVPHLILHGAGRRGELDGQGNTPFVRTHILDEAERDDVLAQVRIDNDPQGVQDGSMVERTCHNTSVTGGLVRTEHLLV